MTSADPYRWLEHAASPATTAWTEQHEAAYDRAASAWSYRESFAAALAELSARTTRYGTPRPAGGRSFFTDKPPGAEHPSLAVADPDGTVRVLLDPMLLAPDGSVTLEHWEPSPDGRRLAYQVAASGTEDSDLYVLDVDSGKLLDGPIDRVRRSTVAWLPDASAFYYVRRLGSDRYHRRVRYHVVGTDPDTDPLTFGEGRERTQFYATQVSADGRWLAVRASAGTDRNTEFWLADLSTGTPEAPRLEPLRQHHAARSSLLISADTLYVSTDLDAQRGRLVTAIPTDPGSDKWQTLIAEDDDSVLEDFVLLVDGTRLVIARTRHAVGEISVHDAATGDLIRMLPLPPGGTVGPLRGAPEGGDEVGFSHSGFTEPPTIYRYDARTDTLVKQFGADVSTTGLETRQVSFKSADGTVVRMFVIARPDINLPAPALLTAYGGFGVSSLPMYSPEAVAWVQAGGIYAVANIRGGAEEGEEWHRAGMREHKQRCFEDFEAAADHLVTLGLTTPDRLGIWGASNGGLLIGAALTRHPTAYGAAACVAPLLDMERYELTGLGPSWTGEYGSAADPEQLAWLLSYSPYHHVRAEQAYPATLFAVFDGDTRVDPLHARKMCAALETADVSGSPVLYRLERGAGHGARSTSRRDALFADLLAFFADQLGL